MNNINVTLLDGIEKLMPSGSTSLDLAKSISNSFSKKIVLAKVNNKICDLSDILPKSCNVELLKYDHIDAVDVLNHTCEHIMAAAVCSIFKDVKISMGPKNHNKNFHYDFFIGRPFVSEDLIKIEQEMKILINKKINFEKKIIHKNDALDLFKGLNQTYKLEILSWINEDSVSIYKFGNFIDLCRGPHFPNSGFIKAFKLLSTSGSYWRANSNNKMLQRITGVAFSCKKKFEIYFYRLSEAKKRDHRKLGESLSLFMNSEKFSTHKYEVSKYGDIAITGKINENIINKNIINLIDEKIISSIENIFNLKFKLSKINLVGVSDDFNFEINIKIFIRDINNNQYEKILLLEKDLNDCFSADKFKIIINRFYSEEIGQGLIMWLPKGTILRDIIENMSKKFHYDNGYEFINSPHIAKSDLWKVSGHLDFYKDDMFSPMIIDGDEYLLKPMNCPFHILAYKNKPKSYRDLPIRYAEFGTVYRYEMAGVMHGLMRARGFTQDDAHIFCRWDQAEEEIDKIISLILNVLEVFGFINFEVKLSTRPDNYVGEIDEWNIAENFLKKAIINRNLPYEVDEKGGAFYGPKIDIKLRDSLDRSWQCSTIQFDFNNPKRFNLGFKNSNSNIERPLMLHRVLFGSIERFIAILIEEYNGAFPFWMSPEQVKIITISERNIDFAYKIKKILKKYKIRLGMFIENQKLGFKIREAQIEKIPLMLIVGDKEEELGGVRIRLRSGEDKGFMKIDELINYLIKKSELPLLR